jgi:hypothetical protein
VGATYGNIHLPEWPFLMNAWCHYAVPTSPLPVQCLPLCSLQHLLCSGHTRIGGASSVRNVYRYHILALCVFNLLISHPLLRSHTIACISLTKLVPAASLVKVYGNRKLTSALSCGSQCQILQSSSNTDSRL